MDYPPADMKRRASKILESDLAGPLCGYLSAQGYTVRSEVKDCDIAAVRGDDLLVIELKKSLNLSLLAQAAKRQRMTDSVYVAVPRPSNMWKWNAENRGVRHLLRRLEIGLIFVSFVSGRPSVEVAFHPAPFARRKRTKTRRAVLEEINNRSGDFNTAGTNRRKLVTAYRESAIKIACRLAASGKLSPAQLRSMGTGPKTQQILYDNVYGWFERIGVGLYALSPRGRRELEDYPRIVELYAAPGGKAGPRSARKKKGPVSGPLAP